MNVCVNCKWFKKPGFTLPINLGKCKFPYGTVDVVTGEPKEHFATNAREFKNLCGPEGKEFVPR